jgi:hypothetical protein
MIQLPTRPKFTTFIGSDGFKKNKPGEENRRRVQARSEGRVMKQVEILHFVQNDFLADFSTALEMTIGRWG